VFQVLRAAAYWILREGLNVLLTVVGWLLRGVAHGGQAALQLLHRERFQNEMGVTIQGDMLAEFALVKEAAEIRRKGTLRGGLEESDEYDLGMIGAQLLGTFGWEEDEANTMLEAMVTNDQGENMGVSVSIGTFDPEDWEDAGDYDGED
jgi:hypothetical protein